MVQLIQHNEYHCHYVYLWGGTKSDYQQHFIFVISTNRDKLEGDMYWGIEMVGEEFERRAREICLKHSGCCCFYQRI